MVLLLTYPSEVTEEDGIRSASVSIVTDQMVTLRAEILQYCVEA